MRMMIAFANSLMLLSSAAMSAAPASRPTGAASCIDPHQMGGRSAESDDTIIFRVGSRIYRNHLASVCPGLSRLNSFGSLETEPWGSQLCRGDSVRVFDQNEARTIGLMGVSRCRLGWFEPVAPTHP